MSVAKKLHDTSAFVMGIDYGEKNIGLALGRNGLVSPLKTITGTNNQTAFHEIMRQAMENKVATFILGLPLNAEGKETEKSLKVRKFANMLKAYSKKPVIYQSEYASTIETKAELVDFELSQKNRRTSDHYVAALILKRYYDSLE